MRAQPYQQKHFKSCTKIIQFNVPNHILLSEQFDCKNFLLRISKRYFVFFEANDLAAFLGYGAVLDKYDIVLKLG